MYKLLSLTILLSCSQLWAQDYFQQQTNYQIQVQLNDKTNSISGKMSLTYTNNSPDDLKFIWFHLWPNAYKNKKTALAKQLLQNGNTDMQYTKPYELGYIDSLNFTVSGKAASTEPHPEHIDICKLTLNEPLKPGASIIIATPFYVKIPTGRISRLGHEAKTYQITQWYPKPAVYDNRGWHPMPYLNQGEFYSEFGSFDVSITLPSDYVVGATGNLQTQSEIDWLDQLANINSPDYNSDADTSVKPLKTIRYTQDKVHDFAWFADKDFKVAKSSVKLPHTGKTVTTWALYNNEHGDLWKEATTYINDALHYYSLWNGDYPYNNCTALLGELSAGAGMEYPTITIIGDMGNAHSLEEVIMHEVGHNWFYGVLAFNERDIPWMDEGINTANEMRYMETKYPNKKLYEVYADKKTGKLLGIENLPARGMYDMAYRYAARANSDQSTNLHSADYTSMNYGIVVYYKAAVLMNYLRAYLGDELYDKAMSEFYTRWQFKHPYPTDLQAVLEEVSEQKLDWFFDDLIGTSKKLDYKVTKLKGNKLTVKNTGEIAGPLHITAYRNKQVIYDQWETGFKYKTEITLPEKADRVVLDADSRMPEYTRTNNRIKQRGLLKKVEPLKLKWLAGIEQDDSSPLYATPWVGWNTSNGIMPGVLLHNGILHEKNFEWRVMPGYSFNSELPTGFADVKWRILQNKSILKNVWITGNAWSFARNPTFRDPDSGELYTRDLNLFRVNYGLKIQLKHNPRSGKKTFILPQYYHTGSLDHSYSFMNQNFFDLTIKHNRSHAIHPYTVNAEWSVFEGSNLIQLEAELKHNYKAKGKAFHARIYIGVQTFNSYIQEHRLPFAGVSSYGDYKLEGIYPGGYNREGIWNRQFTDRAAGFVSPVYPNGNRIVALNLKSDLPVVPLFPFANIAYTNSMYGRSLSGVLWEAGLGITVIPRVFTIYAPLLVSENMEEQMRVNYPNYVSRIRFSLNLNYLNPFDLIRSF